MSTETTNLPFVSALLVTRNEQSYIKKAMLSLVNQTYPKELFEIIVVDGESTDGTLEIVDQLVEKYKTEAYNIRIINNPKHILSSGWNLGIKEARGDYVVRIDAHAEAAPDFIENNVETMLKIKDAVCVGGRLTTKSLSGDDDVISKVLSSPFGVGNSSFRVSEIAGYADTAVYGLYKKEVFEKVGYFNEQYVRNQDIELHSRIRASGGKFYFNPQINCVYYSRNTVKKMVKQAFGNGKWNMVLLKNRNSALRLRHLVPFVFVLYLVTTIVLGFFHYLFWCLGAGIIILHLLIGFFSATKKTKKCLELFRMPFLFLLLHLAYGAGYLAGVFIKI